MGGFINEKNQEMGAKGPESAKASKTRSDFKRALLATLTMGTSEIKTGAGEYGDETLADAAFPKEINNLLLDDRTNARKAADAAKAAEADKLRPGPPPDATAELIRQAGAASLLRQRGKSGRRSTFLSGGK